MSDEYYYPDVEFSCQNCHFHYPEPKIPVGLTVEQYKKQTACCVCGEPISGKNPLELYQNGSDYSDIT